MVLYRMFQKPLKKRELSPTNNTTLPEKNKIATKEIVKGMDLGSASRLLQELCLYTLNPSAITLSPQAVKTLRRWAIDRGQPLDYFFLGINAFNTDIESLKKYRQRANQIWEYNEQLFLSWWQNWLLFRLHIFLKHKRKKKQKSLWDHLIEEGENERPTISKSKDFFEKKAPKSLWETGLKALKYLPEQAQSFVPEFTSQWEILYNHYDSLNKLKNQIEATIIRYELELKNLLQVFSDALKKLELVFSELELKTIFQIQYECQVETTLFYKKLYISSGQKKEIINENIKKKLETTRNLRLLTALEQMDRFANEQQIKNIIDCVQQSWISVYSTLQLTNEVRMEWTDLCNWQLQNPIAPLLENMSKLLQLHSIKKPSITSISPAHKQEKER